MKYTPEEARKLKADFDRDGYVALRGFLDPEQLQNLLRNLDRYIREVVPSAPRADVFYEEKGDTNTLKQLIRMSQHDAFFKEMIEESEFREVADILLGRRSEPQNMQYFNKPPAVGQPTPPHQDGYYWMITPQEGCTMWLALEEVDEENGCVRYARGSHLRGMRPHGRTQTLGFSQGITDFPNEEDRTHEAVMRAQPGDLLVHHALTVHWADGNTSTNRTRKAMGLIYYSDRVVQDEERRAAYKKELEASLEKSGKI